MRAALRPFGVVLATMVVTLLAALPASACSCALSSMEEYVEHADVVARVIVERIELPEGEPYSSMDPATYTVRPTHLWKGDVAGVFTVSSAVSGASCGLEGIDEGSDIVVFAFEGNDGILPDDLDGLKANLCGGTAAADAALVSDVTDVLGQGKPMDVAPEDEVVVPVQEPTGHDGPSAGVWWGLGVGGVLLLAVAGWFVIRGRSSGDV